jgi:hypothetical protein
MPVKNSPARHVSIPCLLAADDARFATIRSLCRLAVRGHDTRNPCRRGEHRPRAHGPPSRGERMRPRIHRLRTTTNRRHTVVYDFVVGIDRTFFALQRIPAIPDESVGEWGQKMRVHVVFSTQGPNVLAVQGCFRSWLGPLTITLYNQHRLLEKRFAISGLIVALPAGSTSVRISDRIAPAGKLYSATA